MNKFFKIKNLLMKQKLEEQQVEEPQPITPKQLLEGKTKTFHRLDLLEDSSIFSLEKINEMGIDIDYLKSKLDGLPSNREIKADSVLDTTDNQYKNVKSIIIDQSIKANVVLDPNTNNYITVKEYIQKYGIIDPDIEVRRAQTAGAADKVFDNDGYYSISTILGDYLDTRVLVEVLNSSDTYEQFKSNLLREITPRRLDNEDK